MVYDIASGDTHQLAPLAFQILTRIQADPCTQDVLTELTPPAVDTADIETLDAIVHHLYTLGLIEPEPH